MEDKGYRHWKLNQNVENTQFVILYPVEWFFLILSLKSFRLRMLLSCSRKFALHHFIVFAVIVNLLVLIKVREVKHIKILSSGRIYRYLRCWKEPRHSPCPQLNIQALDKECMNKGLTQCVVSFIISSLSHLRVCFEVTTESVKRTLPVAPPARQHTNTLTATHLDNYIMIFGVFLGC